MNDGGGNIARHNGDPRPVHEHRLRLAVGQVVARDTARAMSQENARFDDYLILAARLTRLARSERLAFPAVARAADQP